jgi:ParB family chromosome partitioning protein
MPFRACSVRFSALAFSAGAPGGLDLIRADVHPMEEANGLRALLMLEEPKYSIELLAAKIGKTPSFVASRVRLTELIAPVVEAFYAEEIGVGHALLLAKLQPTQQEQALPNCFREEWSGGSGKNKRILFQCVTSSTG